MVYSTAEQLKVKSCIYTRYWLPTPDIGYLHVSKIHHWYKKGKPQCSLVAGAFATLVFGACSSNSRLIEKQASNFKCRHERVKQKQECIQTGGKKDIYIISDFSHISHSQNLKTPSFFKQQICRSLAGNVHYCLWVF